MLLPPSQDGLKDQSSPLPEKRSRSGLILVLIVLVVLAVAGFMIFDQYIKSLSQKPLEQFSKAIESITQRKTSISGNTVILETSDIKELALVKRRIQSMVKYKTRWLGSDNLLILRGEFMVKAGVDLEQISELQVVNGEVSGDWPEAQILSVEMLNYEVYHAEQGSINRLQIGDHEVALNLLLEQARRDAYKSNLLSEVQATLQRRLNDLSQGLYKLPSRWQPPN